MIFNYGGKKLYINPNSTDEARPVDDIKKEQMTLYSELKMTDDALSSVNAKLATLNEQAAQLNKRKAALSKAIQANDKILTDAGIDTTPNGFEEVDVSEPVAEAIPTIDEILNTKSTSAKVTPTKVSATPVVPDAVAQAIEDNTMEVSAFQSAPLVDSKGRGRKKIII